MDKTLEELNREATINGCQIALDDFRRIGMIKAISVCQCNYYDLLEDKMNFTQMQKDEMQLLAEHKYMGYLTTLQLRGEHYSNSLKIADVIRGVIPGHEMSIKNYYKEIALKEYFKTIETL